MPSIGRVARTAVAVAAVAGAAALLVAPMSATWLGPWQPKLLDLGHVPLFGILVLILRTTVARKLLWPVALSVALAAGAELVQPYFGRTADWHDLAGGVLGTLAGAAAVRAWVHRRKRRAAIYALLVVLLPAWPVYHAMPYIRDTIAARRAFPALVDFSTDREMMRWECQQASITREPDPDRPGAFCARVELRGGADVFSWVAFRPVPDFRGYRWLIVEFRVLDSPVELITSLRTAGAEPKKTAHTQLGRVFPPGDYRLRFDLEAMAAAGRPVPLNLADVRWLQFFVYKLPEPRTVLLRKVWLER